MIEKPGRGFSLPEDWAGWRIKPRFDAIHSDARARGKEMKRRIFLVLGLALAASIVSPAARGNDWKRSAEP